MIDYNEVRRQLSSDDWTANPFILLRTISNAYSSNSSVGRELVIRALESRASLPEEYRNLLDELTMQVGLFPYVSALDSLSWRSAIVHASHRADGVMENYVLHSSQARILQKLLDGKSIILSAPTSYGKSLLIDITISAKDFSNVVLIVPTLALVEETRRRMARFVDTYSIITASQQTQSEKNIFVLTQERFLSMEKEMPHIDFFAIDEFYKLADSGERGTQLNQALLKLLKYDAQFYLLGPSIKSVPEIVQDKMECSFIFEDFHTVAVELHMVQKKPNKMEALAKLLDVVDGQTMIYCQSPASTRKVLKNYLELRSIAISEDEELIQAANWTAENYHDQWLVSIALRHGIGIHHGKLPRSLGRFMIRVFEEGKLKVLLCTSTLIEGVNTAAKNVVVYDNILNKKSLDFFTFNNIRGRSGRMFQHFVGHVYLFETPPQEDLPFVDIPAVNPTESTPSSILIQLPSEEIPENLIEKTRAFFTQNILPIELLKSFSGIEPEYLLNTGKYLLNLDTPSLESCAWSGMPAYENLAFSSEIIWEQLGGKSSARQSAILSAAMMTKWIWDLYKFRNVKRFTKDKIAYQIGRGISADEAVENVLAFLRGWASFNYPKYLMALDAVATHVLLCRGLRSCNYVVFASMIEHLFEPSSFSTLEEFGLPTQISQKLLNQRMFDKDDDLESVVNRLRNSDLRNFAIGIFERRIIEDFQAGIGKLKGH